MKFTASTIKGTGYVMNRAENQPFYTIAKTAPLIAKQSANIGFAYKNAETGEYVISLGLDRVVKPDFNAAKAYIKERVA